jgi:uncharacterized membrane protein YphA (DoxX/SURF4 family)
MRTDPWMFLIGQLPDQLALGLFGWVFLALFWALLIGGAVIAASNWRADPSQRTMAHLWTWVARTMMGAMWFQGALWKLPFPQSPGFFHWISQIVEHAAFGWHRALASEVMLPLLPLFQGVAFCGEMGFAISLMLGLAVRLSSLLAIGFVVQLWLGLYRVDFEWPWLFWFMIFTLGWFIVHRAGRRLGLDALLLRERRLAPPLARWHALAS